MNTGIMVNGNVPVGCVALIVGHSTKPF